jgi:16S rRNA (guanine1516-N2)-methyltransferase
MTQDHHVLKTVALTAMDVSDVAAEAAQYQLPMTEMGSTAYDFLLIKTARGWELQDTKAYLKPWRVDFMTPELQQRAKRASIKTELIAKAVGLKPGSQLKVLDATAGIGRDSFILACLGCQVTLLERSPVLAILLQDALRQISYLKLSLHYGDAKGYLEHCDAAMFDVIYLDPMFPEKTKAALVKKDMQILQGLVGADEDSEELFEAARKTGVKRIVVKRPKTAPPLGPQMPNHQVLSKDYRFDVYLQK